MGRKQIYKTEEERRVAQRTSQMKHYWANAKRLKKENLKRYYANKTNI